MHAKWHIELKYNSPLKSKKYTALLSAEQKKNQLSAVLCTHP